MFTGLYWWWALSLEMYVAMSLANLLAVRARRRELLGSGSVDEGYLRYLEEAERRHVEFLRVMASRRPDVFTCPSCRRALMDVVTGDEGSPVMLRCLRCGLEVDLRPPPT